MPERLYIITYIFYYPAGGAYKYEPTPKFEDRRNIYDKSERDAFILEYQRLKDLEQKDIYVDNIRCFATRAIDDITDRMTEIIGAL